MPEIPELLALLAVAPLFKDFSPQRRQLIASAAREITFEPEQLVFSRGDVGHDVYIVAEGRVRLSVLNPEGRLLAFNNAARGDVFGEIAAFDGGLRTADATAMTQVRAYAIPAADMIKFCTMEPAAAQATISFLCARIRTTSAQVEDIALHSITVRIARFFLQALKLNKVQLTHARQGTLDLRFTQAEIADLLGASRQKTNLALSNLTAAKAISRRKGIYTCNVPLLRKFARTD